MKFIHAADLHLDSPLHGLERYPGAPVSRIRTATRQALERLVDLAISEAVSFVLIAGDIYDGDWRDYNTGLYFAAQMSRLRDKGIRVFIISGNHDAVSQISKSLRLPENVHVFSHRHPESVEVDGLGVVIHGQSFGKREMLEDISAHYPTPTAGLLNIGMLHTSATGRPGHESYAPCTVEGLIAKDYQYWALGHVHTREVLHEFPWIVFPGNIQGRYVRESGPKGVSLVSVEDLQIQSVEHRETDVLRWCLCEVDCAEARNGDDVVQCARNALTREMDRNGDIPLAVRIILAGPSPAHHILYSEPEKWVAEIRSAATDLGDVWIEKVKFATRHLQDLKPMLERDDPLARLVRSIDDIEGRPEAVAEFLGIFDDLKRKLPVEFRDGDQLRAFSDPERRRQIAADIRHALLPRLLELPEAR